MEFEDVKDVVVIQPKARQFCIIGNVGGHISINVENRPVPSPLLLGQDHLACKHVVDATNELVVLVASISSLTVAVTIDGRCS